MNNTNDQLLEVFLFEMSTLLEQLDDILLNAERDKSLTQENVAEIFRIMHTIKGSSAMMEYHVIATVTHKLEDTFSYIRNQGISQELFTQLFDLMLEATDFLKNQLACIQQGEPPAEGNESLVGKIEAFLTLLSSEVVLKTEPPSPEHEAVSQPSPAPRVNASEPQEPVPLMTTAPSNATGNVYKIEVLFDENCGMENLRAFVLVTALKPHCSILQMDPPDVETNSATCPYILINGFSLVVDTPLGQKELRELVVSTPHVKSASIVKLESAARTDFVVPISSAEAQYTIQVRFETDCGMENLRAFMLLQILSSFCSIQDYTPSNVEKDSSTAAVIAADGFQVRLSSSLAAEDLKSRIESAPYVDSVALLDSGRSGREAAQPREGAPLTELNQAQLPQKLPNGSTSGKPIKQDLINVSLSKLDEIMDLVGELVITESMVVRSPDLRGIAHLDNFHKSARQLVKLTDELQDMVMSMRMVPISGTFHRMHRIVRDMGRALGKDVELVTIGEETDIDKTIIDNIADPIMHLVRNAMDHGVESPEERQELGKPSRAKIILSAQNIGGEILITVTDDGKGMDPQKMLQRGAEYGLLTKPMTDYTDREAFMLMCAPGFSTKGQVTEFSGRGVGMDVVRSNTEKIGGTVVVESKNGYGTRVSLKIPLTLAIVDGMDISVGDSIYILQITSINESFKATPEQIIQDTLGNEMIMLRGNVYPIIRLHELFDIAGAVTNIEDGILIWVQSGEHSACLFADELIGEQQIVVKPLPNYLKRYGVKQYGISGCTIQGDGNINLILDVGSIVEKVLEKR